MQPVIEEERHPFLCRAILYTSIRPRRYSYMTCLVEGSFSATDILEGGNPFNEPSTSNAKYSLSHLSSICVGGAGGSSWIQGGVKKFTDTNLQFTQKRSIGKSYDLWNFIFWHGNWVFECFCLILLIWLSKTLGEKNHFNLCLSLLLCKKNKITDKGVKKPIIVGKYSYNWWHISGDYY